MISLCACATKGLFAAEYARLAAAYQFLRNLEHRLQMDDDLQMHTLPSAEPQLEELAGKCRPIHPASG